MLVPTSGMPGVVRISDHLRDVTSGIVRGRILFAVDAVMNADTDVATLEIRNIAGVISFHIMLDIELLARTGSVPVVGTGRPPCGRTIISAGLTCESRGR